VRRSSKLNKLFFSLPISFIPIIFEFQSSQYKRESNHFSCLSLPPSNHTIHHHRSTTKQYKTHKRRNKKTRVYDIYPVREQNFNWHQCRHPNLLGELQGDKFYSVWTKMEDQSIATSFGWI
jgi:hypothetical protein